MAAPRSGETLRKEKEAKQKKLLIFVLVPLLAIIAVVQGPRLMKHVDKAKEKTAAVQGDVVKGFEEVSPGGAPTTTTGTATAADPAQALAAAKGLPNTDVPHGADEGQLISFTRFDARDPFVQLVDDTSSDASEAADAGGTSSSASGSDAGTSTATTGTSGTTTATGSTSGSDTGGTTTTGTEGQDVSISVNGTVVVVKVGDTFPADDPAFKLVAVEGSVVKIGLASGSFSNGVDTLDLQTGDSVTLISQPDGKRFTIKITSIG